MNNEVQQQGYQHKCQNCGSSLRFDADSGKLFCEHCKSHFEFDQSTAVMERDFADLVTFSPWDESKVAFYRCQNCGASTVLPRTSLATECPFCQSPFVADENATGMVRPDSLIPFEFTDEEAAKQLTRWRKRRLFAPNKFRKRTKEKGIKGVFVPTWTFDAVTLSNYSGTLGKRRTRTVRRNGKTHTETYIHWFSVSGDITMTFDDIFVRANDNITDGYFNKLQPYDKSKYVVYSDEYLAGYIADNYTVDPLDAFQIARKRMDARIRSAIMSKYNADVQGTLMVDTQETQKSFKYMMLPVYVASTKYHGKLYSQYVSGVYSDAKRTKAKIAGKSPVSFWKVLATVLAGIAAVVGIYLLVCHVNGTQPFDFLMQADQVKNLIG